MNARKLGVVCMSVALVVAGGVVSWSAAGGHGHSLRAGRTTAADLAAAASASPSPTPTATPNAKSPAASKTAAPSRTLNPANKTTPASPGCGEVVRKSIKLDANLINCAGDGIIVGADNITIDLADNVVSGTKSDNSGGIRNDKGFKGVTIRGGEVRGFDTGVILGGKGAIHNTIEDLTLAGNNNGISMSGGGSNAVDNNTIDNGGFGIKAASDSNKITENDVANARPGIALGGNSNTLLENAIKKGGDGITGSGDKNSILNNDLRNGAGGGIVLLGSDNQVNSNSIKHYGSVGIWLQQVNGSSPGPSPTNSTGTAVQKSTSSKSAHDDTVRDNDVSFVGHDGILLDSASSTLDSNDSSHNAGDGIATRGVSPLINDNDANGNTGHGIAAAGGVRGSGNSANGNGESDCSPAALCD